MILFEWDYFRIGLHNLWSIDEYNYCSFTLFKIDRETDYFGIVFFNFGIKFEWDKT